MSGTNSLRSLWEGAGFKRIGCAPPEHEAVGRRGGAARSLPEDDTAAILRQRAFEADAAREKQRKEEQEERAREREAAAHAATAAAANATSDARRATAASTSGPPKKRGKYNKKIPKRDQALIGTLYAMHGTVTKLEHELRYAAMPSISAARRAELAGYADCLPQQRTLCSWKMRLQFTTPGVGRPLLRTSRQVLLARADAELLSAFRALRQRGTRITFRNIVQLRAGQLLANPSLMAAIIRKRRSTTEARRRRAVLSVVRTGDCSTAATTTALANANSNESGRRRSVFMSREWAQKFCKKYNISVRCVTSSKVASQVDPVRMDNMIRRVAFDCARYEVPKWALWNADETAWPLYVREGKTLEKRGSADAVVNGAHLKAAATSFETFNAEGCSTKRLIVFAGKSDRVLPANHAQLEGVVATFSRRGWVDQAAMMRTVDDIWLPWATQLRELHNKPHQVIILLLDVYWAHFDRDALEKLCRNRIKVVPVEPGLTAQLQPADHACGINRILKPLVRSRMNELAVVRMVQQLDVSDEWKEAVLKSVNPTASAGSNIVLSGGDECQQTT